MLTPERLVGLVGLSVLSSVTVWAACHNGISRSHGSVWAFVVAIVRAALAARKTDLADIFGIMFPAQWSSVSRGFFPERLRGVCRPNRANRLFIA
jgi:hypothetical protein